LLAGCAFGTSAGCGGWFRSRSCDTDQRAPLVLLLVVPLVPELAEPEPVLLPAPEPLLPPVPEPELELDPEPVSVETEPEMLPDVPGVVEAVVDVSLEVDDDVGVEAVVLEPGVALVPELLYEVLPVVPAPRLQPGRAAVARARTAT
jgi:hypothetical protein